MSAFPAAAVAALLSVQRQFRGARMPWRGETSEEIEARRAKRKVERQARKKNRRRA